MLKDALEFIALTATKANEANGAARIFRPDGWPEHRLLKLARDGSHEILTADPAPRFYQLDRLDQIAPFVLALDTLVLSEKPSLWIESNDPDKPAGAIVITWNESPIAQQLSSARCELHTTPQFQILYDFETAPEGFTHADFIRFLRRHFSESLPNFPALLKMLKKITFQNGTVLTTTAETRRESVGREIASAIGAEAGDIPETLDITVPVFTDRSIPATATIPCLLDLTPTGQFRLIPLTGKTRDAIAQAHELIRLLLTKDIDTDEIPIYYGSHPGA